MGDVDIPDTGLGRPLEGGQALRWLPVPEAADLIISLEDEPFLGGADRIDAGSDVTKGRDVDFPTDGSVLDVGAVNREARSGTGAEVRRTPLPAFTRLFSGRWLWCLSAHVCRAI